MNEYENIENMLDEFEKIIIGNYSADEIYDLQGAADSGWLVRLFEKESFDDVMMFMLGFEEAFTLREVRAWTRIFTRMDENKRAS